jgi:hypothetical protein
MIEYEKPQPMGVTSHSRYDYFDALSDAKLDISALIP